MSGESPAGERRLADTVENRNGGSICERDSGREASTSSNVEGSGKGVEELDVLARAISSMLGSVISDFDSRAENAAGSQDAVSAALDRLMSELDKLLEDAPLPFIMQHAVKISGVRKRVLSLNLLLKSIQQRIDNIDRMLSTEKMTSDTVGQSQH